MATTDLKKIVEKIQKLPSLPQVVTKVLALVRDPKSSADDLQKIMAMDQSLSLKTMRLVNSAFYGYAGRIKSLSQAVVILGFDSIKSIALSASVFDTFKGVSKSPLKREHFWQHSIAVGVCSRMVAADIKLDDPEGAFFAGLIHDIGKVILDQYAHEEFVSALNHAQEKEMLLFEAERELLGVSHAQVGRWLATKWNLPEDIVDAIFYHHQPSYAQKAPRLTSVIHLANVVVQNKAIGKSGNPKVPPLDPFAWKTLQLDKETISRVMERLDVEMSKADAFLQMAKGA